MKFSDYYFSRVKILWFAAMLYGSAFAQTTTTSLTVNGPSTLNGTLNVSGMSTFTNNVSVTGTVSATGLINTSNNLLSIGTQGAQGTTYGLAFQYADNSVPAGSANVDSATFVVNRYPGSWLWEHNDTATTHISAPAMRLDSAHKLLLFSTGSTLSSSPAITLTPSSSSPSLALGTATLTASSSNLSVNGAFTVANGITNTSGAITGGASGLSLDAGSTGDLIFKTNGTERARIKSTGSVGIGTSAPAGFFEISKAGPAVYISDTGNSYAQFAVRNTSSSFYFGQENTAGGSMLAGSSPLAGIINMANANPLQLGTTNSVRMTIGATGNVGIGTTSWTAYGARLAVHYNSAADQVMTLRNTNASGLSSIRLEDNNGNYEGDIGYYNLAGSAGIRIGGNAAVNTYFPSGNVGIGTTSPNTKFEVAGVFRSTDETGLPTTGKGIEISYQSPSDRGRIIAYDRTNSIYKPLNFEASTYYFQNGSVGIGATSAGQRLTVWGTNGLPATTGSSADGVARFGSSVTNLVLDVGLVGGGTPVSWLQSRQQNSYDSNYNLALNPNGGNVGVGTLTPAASLDVGGLTAGGALRTVFARQAEGNSTGAGTFLGVKAWGTQATPYNNKLFSIESSFYGYLNSSIEFYRGSGAQGGFTTFTTGDGTERVRIDPVGNVGIGTTNPTQKLSVAGTIRAYAVVVDNGWSDYVFKPDYMLASLSEVEGAIKREGHLPGIPSEADVAKHGVSLGDMQSKLLAKVEELTLHLIAQEKEIASLRQQVSEIKSSAH